MVLYIIGGFAPTIAAIACILKDRVMPLKQFIKTIFAVKQPVRMYLYALGFAALYYGIPALLGRATIVSPLYMALISLPTMVIGGGLEEVGWRFILQPTLERKFPFVIATAITAVIWALWHLPLFFIQGTYQYTQNFGLFTIGVFGLSFALAAIYRISNSIWICIFFHSVVNSVLECVSINNTITSTVITSAVLIVVSLAAISLKSKQDYTQRNLR